MAIQPGNRVTVASQILNWLLIGSLTAGVLAAPAVKAPRGILLALIVALFFAIMARYASTSQDRADRRRRQMLACEIGVSLD